MIRYLVDHCFDEDVLRALARKSPGMDFVLARDVGLAEAEDPDVLAWAAQEDRVVMTHDRNTMIGFAVERIRKHEAMAGLVLVSQFAPLATRIEDILLLTECTEPAEWRDRIEYVPL